jgi:hypothetical protein
MTSFRQLEANRRNALRSTGPKTDEGKQRSRFNAIRHGLTAETVVGCLEDAEDYKAFEAIIIADYCAETAVARELVLRLASLLWRLRRATAIETGLFELIAEARPETDPREVLNVRRDLDDVVRSFRSPDELELSHTPASAPSADTADGRRKEHQVRELHQVEADFARTILQLTYSFLQLAKRDDAVFEHLNRYEAALWRQTVQIVHMLQPIKLR